MPAEKVYKEKFRTADSSAPAANPPGRWRRAMAFATPHRRSVQVIFFLTLLIAAIGAAEPLVLKGIFDGLTSDRKIRALVLAVALLLALGIFHETANALSSWMTWRVRLGVHYQLLEATVERLHRLPLSFQRTEGVGAIMTKLDRSIQGFVGALTQLLFNVFPALLYLLIAAVVMVRLNWQMALLVLCFAPLPGVIAMLTSPEQTERERALLQRWSRIYSRFNEVLSGILTVRSFSMEEWEKKRFLTQVDEANKLVIRGVGLDSGFGAASNLIIVVARVMALALGIYFILINRITVGTLIAFLGYIGGLFGPVQGLSTIYQTVQRATVSLDEIFAILDTHETLGDSPRAREVSHVRGDVNFNNISFSYGRNDRPILSGLNLKVRAGEHLAIVGPSGAGKTTLMALLMRFYDPVEGFVELDGSDLRELKQSSLRRNIGVVLQDPLLFNDTIRGNIAYGRPQATQAEIERAAKAANAHDFISRMAQGYDSVAGERGSLLSVGERQRITIARALVKDPPIIVLDEATSSLDAESEALVQEALDKLIQNRTTFIIAHRLATVVHADRIVVLKNGSIAEAGSHHELMRRNGYYASLVERQTRGLIRNEGE